MSGFWRSFAYTRECKSYVNKLTIKTRAVELAVVLYGSNTLLNSWLRIMCCERGPSVSYLRNNKQQERGGEVCISNRDIATWKKRDFCKDPKTKCTEIVLKTTTRAGTTSRRCGMASSVCHRASSWLHGSKETDVAFARRWQSHRMHVTHGLHTIHCAYVWRNTGTVRSQQTRHLITLPKRANAQISRTSGAWIPRFCNRRCLLYCNRYSCSADRQNTLHRCMRTRVLRYCAWWLHSYRPHREGVQESYKDPHKRNHWQGAGGVQNYQK